MGFDGGAAHQIEGAVLASGTEADEQAVVAEGGELITDAFFGLGGGGANRLAEFLESGALRWSEAREIFVDGFRFGGHGGHAPYSNSGMCGEQEKSHP